MRRPSLVPLVFALVLAHAPQASATVGEDTTLELLGYSPREGKIFLLEDNGHETSLCFVRLDDARHRTVRSRRWAAFGRERFATELARLRQRLVPLVRIRRSAYQVRLERREAWRAWSDFHEMYIRRRRVGVTLSWGPHRGELSAQVLTNLQPVEARARVRVEGLWRVPGRDEAIGIVSAFTDPMETGYFQDALVFVR